MNGTRSGVPASRGSQPAPASVGSPGRGSQRDALVEALAGQLAHAARAGRLDVAEQIRSAFRAAGFTGPYLDAGHLVGALPPGIGGIPPPAELVDDAAVTLLDDDGVVLVVEAGAASADHTHPATGGPPTGTAGGDLTGTYPNPQIAAGVVTDLDVATANKDGAAATASMRTIGAGATQAAAGNHTHGAAAPAAHATTHQPGGADAMAVDAAAATGSLRTIGTAATAAAAGNHTHAGMLTNPMTSVGDIIVGGASGAPGRLAAGTNTHVLTLAGGTPTWAAPATGAPTAHASTHQPGGADPMAVDAAAGTGSLRTLGTGATQAAPGNDSRFGSGGPPTGTAGGDLAGTYPNPQIAAGVIVDADVAVANKDGLTTVASLRTLGTGAQQAAAGNDSRFTNARTPTAHATTHQPGGSDPLAVDAVAATGSLRTLGAGAQQASAGTHTHGAAAPAAHATTHQPGGSDAMAVDAVAGTGSLRTLGTSATSAAAGNDARLTDSRAPSGTAGGDLSGTYPNPQIAAGVIVDADVATANKDGAAATPSLRTLGTGAVQAAAGNHAHAAYVTNPMTTSQDLIVGGASGTPGRLGVGGSTQVLTVVGGVLTWATPASGFANPMTSVGDVIVGGASGAAGRLGVGTTDQVLSVVAGAPAWASPIATDNLLTNPGLEVWSRGAGAFTGTVPGGYGADRWQNDVGGGSIFSTSRDSANADVGSQYCAAVTFTYNAESGFRQDLEHYVQLRGRTLTLAIRVKTSTANAVRASLYDSVNGLRYSAYHTGGGAYETLTVSAPIAAATTSVRAALRLGTSCTVYVDNATLVVGSAALAYAPLHPADEMSRCQRYYHEVGGLANYDFACQGMAFSATSVGGLIRPHPVEMAVTPTMTVSSAAHWAVYTANGTITTLATLTGGGGLSRKAMQASGTVASGLVAGNATTLFTNNTTAARITFEASP